jgi:hypothetical protein
VSSPVTLSPTFGGVPVIAPPPQAATVPWASFEQPYGTHSPAIATPRDEVVVQAPPTDAAVSGEHASDAAHPETPAQTQSAAPNPDGAEGAAAPLIPAGLPSGDDAGLEKEEPKRAAPSEFHRWLEGLT